MQKFLLLIIVFVFTTAGFAQTKISGTVTDKKGEPIVGANIYLKDTYSGTTSDIDGRFTFSASVDESSILVVSFIGYKIHEQIISAIPTNDLKIVLKESSNNLNAVTITAGSFDASDETKSVTMRPVDILTTPSGEGDIYGAINTMPGTQSVGEEGGIFVRGGEGYETQTYIDGMLVKSPYSSSMPDVPSRGKFSPFLFSGTMFSTGGYSAEYGQALSSALVLKTNALPEKSATSLSLLSVGTGLSHTKRWERASVSANIDYENLAPYYKLSTQEINWFHAPEALRGSFLFRQKTGESGMVKSFIALSREHDGLNYHNVELGQNQRIDMKTDNIYVNTVYNDMLSDNWQFMAGVSYNFDNEGIDLNNDRVETIENTYQVRTKFTNHVNEELSIKLGLESILSDYNQDYYAAFQNTKLNTNFTDSYFAAFIEPEIKISAWFAARLGSRLEYSSLNNQLNLQPRLSLAAKLATHSQLSVAYGTFQQTAQNDYRKFNNDLKAEQASHYILNFQYVKNKRTFRAEAYYKDYNNLVKYQQLNMPVKESYDNNGTGYAKGIDIFWRDRKTFKNIDYYFSYSYISTERNYLDYTGFAPPKFTSEHNFSAVYKQYISKLSTQVGATYSFSSGRPYFNPNEEGFMTKRTPFIHDLSVNLSHMTKVFNKDAIIHLSASNVLGLDKTFGYRYPNQPNANMIYPEFAIKPAAKRFFVVAFFLSI